MAVVTTKPFSDPSLPVGDIDLAGRVLMRRGQSAVLICGGRRRGGGGDGEEAIDTCYEKQGPHVTAAKTYQ